jgi:hypothetical protein
MFRFERMMRSADDSLAARSRCVCGAQSRRLGLICALIKSTSNACTRAVCRDAGIVVRLGTLTDCNHNEPMQCVINARPCQLRPCRASYADLSRPLDRSMLQCCREQSASEDTLVVSAGTEIVSKRGGTRGELWTDDCKMS